MAKSVAERTLRRDAAKDATVSSISATVKLGTILESESNTGHGCLSGRLLTVKIIGDFPHTVTTGHPVPAKDRDHPPDFTVHSLVVTADEGDGGICLLRVQTGNVTPDPGATLLDLG